MSKSKWRPKSWKRFAALGLGVMASMLLVGSLKFPLWEMRLEAPQYRDEEALNIAVHPNALRGDLKELKVLNQYIGVHVPPTLPQFRWMPGALIAAAALGVIACFLPRCARARALLIVFASLATALIVAMLQAQSQMHDIGHNRDQKTILVGMRDFTPPLLGTAKIAQFTVSSRFGTGALLIGSALALQMAAAWFSRRPLTATMTRRIKPQLEAKQLSYANGYNKKPALSQ